MTNCPQHNRQLIRVDFFQLIYSNFFNNTCLVYFCIHSPNILRRICSISVLQYICISIYSYDIFITDNCISIYSYDMLNQSQNSSIHLLTGLRQFAIPLSPKIFPPFNIHNFQIPTKVHDKRSKLSMISTLTSQSNKTQNNIRTPRYNGAQGWGE
jgi:hypothetical protein